MLTKTCQWTVAHANQTQLSQIPSRVHILHISTGWLHWEIRLRLGHSGLGVIRAHSFLLGQIKPSMDQAGTFHSSHSTSSHHIYPRAVIGVNTMEGCGVGCCVGDWLLRGQLLPRCVFVLEQGNGSSLGEITAGTAREGWKDLPPGTCDIGRGLCWWHLEESWHR